jgi:hypothetical protein
MPNGAACFCIFTLLCKFHSNQYGAQWHNTCRVPGLSKGWLSLEHLWDFFKIFQAPVVDGIVNAYGYCHNHSQNESLAPECLQAVIGGSPVIDNCGIPIITITPPLGVRDFQAQFDLTWKSHFDAHALMLAAAQLGGYIPICAAGAAMELRHTFFWTVCLRSSFGSLSTEFGFMRLSSNCIW